MTGQDPSQFDDPALKRAVQRVLGSERAPASLRERIAAQMAQMPAARTPDRGRPFFFSFGDRRRLAAAAIALIAIGFAAYRIYDVFYPVGAVHDAYTLTSVPVELASAMVKQHDAAAQPGRLQSVNGQSLEQVRQLLAKKNEVSIPNVKFAGEWKLTRFGQSKFGEHDVAQMLFERNGESVSVFSLSSLALPGAPDGAAYSQLQDGHPMSGFVRGAGLHCVVGSGNTKLSLKDVESLRNQLEVEPTTHPCETSPPVAVAIGFH